jgi:hypothetical protein
MGKRDTTTQLKLTAILWAALGYFAKKSVNRDDIPISESTRVDVTIEGKIGRSKISERLCCDLVRNPDTSRASSSGAPMPELIAYLFDQFDETRRYQIQQDVLDYWEAGATVPVPAEAVTATKNWLSQLRTKSEQPVAGAIVATMVEAS